MGKRLGGLVEKNADVCRGCGGLLLYIDTNSIPDGGSYECRACGRRHTFAVTAHDEIYVSVGPKPRAKKGAG